MNDIIDVLYADTSHSDGNLVCDILENNENGFRVTQARSRNEFESRLDKESYNVVLSELGLFDYGELEVISVVRGKAPTIPVLIVTGRGSEELAVKAMKSGAADYVVKDPDGMRRLPSTIRSVLGTTLGRPWEPSRLARQLRTFAYHLPDHLVILDRDGIILEINYETEHLKRSRAIGRPILEVIPRKDRETVKARFDRVIATGEHEEYEIKLDLGRDGTRHLHCRAAPLRDQAGVVGVTVSVRDVTQFRQSESRMSCVAQAAIELVQSPETEDLYVLAAQKVKQLAGGSIVVVNSIDVESQTLWVRSVVGVEQNHFAPLEDFLKRELIGTSFDNVSKEIINVLSSGRLCLLEGGLHDVFCGRVPRSICRELEKRVGPRDIYSVGLNRGGMVFGNITIFHSPGVPLRADVIETFVNAAAMAIEQRRMAKKLRESENRYRTIIENQTDLICRFGPDMALSFVNQAVCQMIDQPREAVLGRRMEEFVHPDDRESVQRQIAALTPTCPVSFLENRYVLPNGETRWGQWSNCAVFDQAGNIQEIQSVGRDVTAQHEMQQQLRENEAMLSQAEEIAGVGSFIWNSSDNSLQWSRNMYTIFGLKKKEFAGNLEDAILQSVHPDDRMRVRSEVESMLAMKETWPFEYRIIRPDGQVRLLRSGAKWLFDSDGEEPACLGVLLDVTEQKETEKAREASQRFLQLTLDALSSNIAILDETGAILYVNSAWREFARCNQAPVDRVVEGANYLQVCDEATGEDAGQARECASRIREVLRGEVQSFSLEYPCHSPDERRWFVGCVTRFSTDGQCRVVVAHENITERKLAEEALAEAKLHLELALQAADIGTWDWDLTTGNVFFSREWKRQLGYEEDEIASHHREWEQRLHPDDLQTTVKTLNEYLEGRTADYCTEFRLRHKDGGYRWIFTRGKAVRDKTGNPLRLSGCNVDISERKAKEKQLAEAKEAAEAASRAKSTFLANMSHEIRTPMAAITGFTELLLTEERAPDEQREYLTTIQRNAQSLLMIINDILDLSKIEAEKLEVEPMDCSPRQLVEDVKKSLRRYAEEKGLGFDVTYVEPLPLSIRTDPQRVRQILINLVGNAIKFTDTGGVRIIVRGTLLQAGRSRIQFAVADTGIGISSGAVTGLFEPFTQAETTATREFGGTGLGLSLSQRLAHMLGGQIEVVSDVGQGSTFTLTIDAGPIRRSEEPGTSPSIAEETALAFPEPLQGRVLLAEDLPDLAKLVQHMLERTNLELDVAKNGAIAYEKAMFSQEAGRPYELILMDIRMPIMDGYQVTRRLRDHGWTGPIVALTASAMEGAREKCLKAGCNDYLSKPVDHAKFFQVLNRYLTSANADAKEGKEEDRSRSAEAKLFEGFFDEATVDELVQEYANKLAAKAEAVEQALQARDSRLLAGLAHELKGVAGMYGFSEVSDKALSLQKLAAEAETCDELASTVAELTKLCRKAAKQGRRS